MQISNQTIKVLENALTRARQQRPLGATELDAFEVAIEEVRKHKNACSNYAEVDGSELRNGYGETYAQ